MNMHVNYDHIFKEREEMVMFLLVFVCSQGGVCLWGGVCSGVYTPPERPPPPAEMATAAVGRHPTGMHAC